MELVSKGAFFSPCRTWRYLLWREWRVAENSDPQRDVAFIGLNPSTADENADDPTIRRCIGFAKAWGYDGILMLNLFAFRATDPADMKRAVDPVGPENDAKILESVGAAAIVVAAWGQHGAYRSRAFDVRKKLLKDFDVKCLGKTNNGHPRHPLYVRGDAKLIDL